MGTDYETLKEELEEFYKTPEGVKFKESLEETRTELERMGPYLKMSEEELQEHVPDGAYQIGGGNLVAWTGKQGFINYVLLMKKTLFPDEKN